MAGIWRLVERPPPRRGGRFVVRQTSAHHERPAAHHSRRALRRHRRLGPRAGPPPPHLGEPPPTWATLGYRRVSWEPGQTEVAWDADEAYCFPSAGGPIVQGGLVTALLDAGMGGACGTGPNRGKASLTGRPGG